MITSVTVITVSEISDSKIGNHDAQIANDDVCTGRRVIASNADMSTGFMAILCQFPDLSTFHRKVTPRNLHTGGSNSAHDEGEEKRVAFLTPRLQVGHEGGFMDAWR